MIIEFDPAKRLTNLEMRGLDFLEASEIFEGPTLTYEDVRQDYGETRWITVGLLYHRMIILVWTERGENCRIISMRKANERERESFSGRLV